jgi:DNA ligase-1
MTHTSPNIFRRDSTGKVRTWSFTVENDSYRTIAGGPGRKDVTSGWTKCVGKQGRNDFEQAVFEANAEYHKKLAREYRTTEAELVSVPRTPMLAHKYEGGVTFPVFSQPKQDGARALISRHGAFTRDYQRWLNCDHILQALAPLWLEYPDIVLDGEFYNHDLKDDFGKIMSMARKQKPTPADRAEAAETLQYHIYDVGDDSLPFADRAHWMEALDHEGPGDLTGYPLRFVDTREVTTPEELDAHYATFLEQGYEGQMVRLNNVYEFDKRSKSLLKRKEFITAEFKLLRIEEGLGNWAGYAKKVTFEVPDGRECGAGIRGTMAEMKELFDTNGPQNCFAIHPDALVTIRHFAPTPDGMPRFPVAIDFHFGGRKD